MKDHVLYVIPPLPLFISKLQDLKPIVKLQLSLLSHYRQTFMNLRQRAPSWNALIIAFNYSQNKATFNLLNNVVIRVMNLSLSLCSFANPHKFKLSIHPVLTRGELF